MLDLNTQYYLGSEEHRVKPPRTSNTAYVQNKYGKVRFSVSPLQIFYLSSNDAWGYCTDIQQQLPDAPKT